MARAKKLSCNHLFHLACLRSWYASAFCKFLIINYDGTSISEVLHVKIFDRYVHINDNDKILIVIKLFKRV